MSSNLKVNSLVPATGTEIGIGTTGGSIDFRCPATFGGNVTIGGTLTYDEVINIDSIGIVTARSGLKVTGGQLDVGSNIKLGNAGVITATSFVGAISGTTGTFTGDCSIADKITHSGDLNTAIRFPAADTISFETAGSESFRIDTNGRILIGHTINQSDFHGPQTTTGRNPYFQLHGANASNAGLGLISWKNQAGSYYAPTLYLAHSGSDTKGTNGILPTNGEFGSIVFSGDDGTDFVKGAMIKARLDGTPGNDDMPGMLQFYTTPDGAQTPVERLRIDSSGHLKPGTNDAYNLGTSSLKWANVYVDNYVYVGTTGSSFKDNQLLFKSSGTAFIDHFTTGQDIQFRTSVNSALDTSSVKITSAGNIAFGINGRGIDFSVASGLQSGRGTSTSHILDDYEEGDYTPTFTVQSGTVTLDSSTKTLSYTKIGRQVTIIGQLKIASVSNPSGIFRALLPFSRANQTEQAERTMGNIMVYGAAVNNMNEFATYPDGGVDSYLEIISISGTTINRNGGQNMQANALIYVNYTYFTY